jgi:hypothetical protein
MGTCFVIQPFDDGGEYDRRYEDVIKPLINNCDLDLDSYRVDRDPSARIVYKDIENIAQCKSSATQQRKKIPCNWRGFPAI